MCLNTVDEKTRKNVKYGYKIFEVDYNEIYGECYSVDGHINFYRKSEPYELNKWYKATDYIIGGGGNKYESGFHVFTNKKDADIWRIWNQKIFKVEVKNIVASGAQFMNIKPSIVEMAALNVVVAKEMRILEEVT
jgi:hypothetical protein